MNSRASLSREVTMACTHEKTSNPRGTSDEVPYYPIIHIHV